jgi:hypothetical protein
MSNRNSGRQVIHLQTEKKDATVKLQGLIYSGPPFLPCPLLRFSDFIDWTLVCSASDSESFEQVSGLFGWEISPWQNNTGQQQGLNSRSHCTRHKQCGHFDRLFSAIMSKNRDVTDKV